MRELDSSKERERDSSKEPCLSSPFREITKINLTNIKTKICLFQQANQLGANHSKVKGIQCCPNERQCSFSREDKSKPERNHC